MLNAHLSRRMSTWLMLLILLLAALLRIWNIEAQSLWIDEGFTWNLTQYHDPLRILQQDVHPPLYFILVDGWVALSGTSVFAMRFFSVLPGLLSVALVYALGREVQRLRGSRGAVVPLLAALLLALADAEIFLAQEVRSYTWHVFFAISSMAGFVRWQRTAGRGALLLWLLSTIALVYTFYLGAFVGLVQGLYALFALRGQKRLVALGVLGVAAGALLPWLLFTGTQQAGNVSRAEIIALEDYPFWLNDFRQRYFSQQWALMIGLLLLGVLTIHGADDQRRYRVHPTAILLLLWVVLPTVLIFLGNLQVPLYQPRRISQIVPAIALLTAYGIANLPRSSRGFVVAVIVVYSLFSVDFWRYKQPWAQMAEQHAPYIAPGVPLLFELGGDDYAPRYHFAQELPAHDFLLDAGTPAPDENLLLGLTTWRQLEPEGYAAGLPAFIQEQEHLWLFYWSSDMGALTWLQQFGLQRSATFAVDFNPDVFLYRYDRPRESTLVRYDNGLVLQAAFIHDEARFVELLWWAEQPLREDYTVSVALLDAAGRLVAQHDAQPFLNQRPTSTWQPQQLIYDPKPLQALPGTTLVPGSYQVVLVVYHNVQGTIERLLTVELQDLSPIGELEVRQ